MAWNACDGGTRVDFRPAVPAHHVAHGLKASSRPLHLAGDPDLLNATQRPATIDIARLLDLDANAIDWDDVPEVAIRQFGRRYRARPHFYGGNLRLVLELPCSVLKDGVDKSPEVLIGRVGIAGVIKDWSGALNGVLRSTGWARWGG